MVPPELRVRSRGGIAERGNQSFGAPDHVLRGVDGSDEALLAGLASGDAEAAAAFVRRFQRRVYGLALTILREPAAAEDAAQEAFLRAWRHAETYDPRRGRVLTWLLGIARNVAIDTVRLKRAEPLDPETLANRMLANGARECRSGRGVRRAGPPS